jgi:hypothetical protein
MPRIFICYRRNDTAQAADKLYHLLSDRFGNDNIYMDKYSNSIGDDYEVDLLDALTQSAVMLVIIGPTWKDKFATHQTNDEVIFEIQHGLRRKSPYLVIPVLIDTAMPNQRDLPEAISKITTRSALDLHTIKVDREVADRTATIDPDFTFKELELDRLIQRIEKISPPPPPEPLPPDDERPTEPNQPDLIPPPKRVQRNVVAAFLTGAVLIAVVVVVLVLLSSQTNERRILQTPNNTVGTVVMGIGPVEFTPTPSPSATASPTATYTNTPTPTYTFTASPTATLTPTRTQIPTSTPSLTPTSTRTFVPCTVSVYRNRQVTVHIGPDQSRRALDFLRTGRQYPVTGYALDDNQTVVWFEIDFGSLTAAEPGRQWVNSGSHTMSQQGDCQPYHLVQKPTPGYINEPTRTPTSIPTATSAYQPPQPQGNGGGNDSGPIPVAPTSTPWPTGCFWNNDCEGDVDWLDPCPNDPFNRC